MMIEMTYNRPSSCQICRESSQDLTTRTVSLSGSVPARYDLSFRSVGTHGVDLVLLIVKTQELQLCCLITVKGKSCSGQAVTIDRETSTDVAVSLAPPRLYHVPELHASSEVDATCRHVRSKNRSTTYPHQLLPMYLP